MNKRDDRRVLFLYTVFFLMTLSALLTLLLDNRGDGVACYALNSNSTHLSELICDDSENKPLSFFEDPDSSVFHFAPLPINSASAELLQTINGVGPKLSQMIVDYRAQKGPFTDSETIKKLPGVGAKRAQLLATQFTYN